MAREWPLTSIRRADAGPSQSAIEISCGACGHKDHAVNSGGLKVLPGAWVENYFAQKGWHVGRKPADDRCPKCAAEARADKRALASERKEKAVAAAPTAAEPPRQMDFEDRRLIIRKLEEVYVDAKTGYDSGWSDKRVADDLGVPRAWVAELREANFGPARDNEEIRAFLARFDAHVAKVREVDERAEAVKADAVQLLQETRALVKVADSIRKAVT